MVSSTVPRPAAKCPPHADTVSIRKRRNSSASAVSCDLASRRKAAGESISESSGNSVCLSIVITGKSANYGACIPAGIMRPSGPRCKPRSKQCPRRPRGTQTRRHADRPNRSREARFRAKSSTNFVCLYMRFDRQRASNVSFAIPSGPTLLRTRPDWEERVTRGASSHPNILYGATVPALSDHVDTIWIAFLIMTSYVQAKASLNITGAYESSCVPESCNNEIYNSNTKPKLSLHDGERQE